MQGAASATGAISRAMGALEEGDRGHWGRAIGAQGQSGQWGMQGGFRRELGCAWQGAPWGMARAMGALEEGDQGDWGTRPNGDFKGGGGCNYRGNTQTGQ